MQNVNQKTLKEGDNFKDYILDRVKEMYLQDGELAMPLAVLMQEDKKAHIVAIPMEVPSKEAGYIYKKMVAKQLKEMAVKLKAVRYLWIAESWMAKRPVDDPQMDLMPSDDPKAVTCLIVADETVHKCVTDIYFPEILDVHTVEIKHAPEYTMAHKKGDPLGTFQGILYDPNSLDLTEN